jgi:hypothetical protein
MGGVDMEKRLDVGRAQMGNGCAVVSVLGIESHIWIAYFIFFRKSSTRSFYLMNFSQIPLRGAEIWHIWKQHHVIECFWKIMKSIFHMRSMQLQGDGLYTALLIKVLAYLLALRLQAAGMFSKLTITEIMRKLRREEDVREFLAMHFHAPFSIS